MRLSSCFNQTRKGEAECHRQTRSSVLQTRVGLDYLKMLRSDNCVGECQGK